jgi:hypothetical protein
MKDASAGSDVSAFAGKTKANTQSNSHAKGGFQQFIGTFDGSAHPGCL